MINLNLKALSDAELNELEQQILIERGERIASAPATITFPTNTAQKAYIQTIETILLNIFEVDISLNEIINEIAASQSEAIVMRNGSPVARILLLTTTSPQSHYPLRGKPITIAGDFDEPMPDLWDALAE